MTKHLLFARIGYMQYYAGPQKGDEKPKHGGSYTKNKIGHEVFNFKTAKEAVYGFFQPYLKRGAEITLNEKRNSLVLILSVGRRDINLNYYTGQLEPLPYQQ